MSLMIAAASLAAAVPIVGLAAPNDPVLPDLVADPPQRQIQSNYTYPDGTQARLLRFDGYVHNIGPGPLEIRASARSGANYTNVRQFVATVGGGMVANDPPPGPPIVRYETGDGHNHWHLQEIARYSLWNSARTAETSPGMKAGFCLVDSERRETTGPGAPVYNVGDTNFCGQNEPSRSSLTMGVSAGWRDLYHRDLAFQWVDISDVQPGTYWLAAEIDTDNVIREADETNNQRVYSATSSTIAGYRATAVNAGTVPFGSASTLTLAAQTVGSPGARRFRIESLPGHGTLKSGTTTLAVGSVITGSTVTYTPAGGYSGPDTFDFSAFDSTSAFPRTPAAAALSLTVGQQSSQAQVAVSGAPESLDIGTSAQLTATVVNAPPGVTWSVNGVAGGNATVGTVSGSGLYRAPDALPTPRTVTIRATSTSDPTAFGEAAILITDPGEPNPAPQPPANLVRNPSFESSTSNWASWQASVTREQLSDAPNGVWAAKVTRTSGTAFTIDDDPETIASASASTSYEARAFVKAASPSAVGKRVRIYLREGTPGPTGRYLRMVSGPTVALTNSFQAVSASITPQTQGNELEVIVSLSDGATAGDAFYVDQISFPAGSSEPPPPPPPPPTNTPPSPSFTATPSNPQVGQSVSFADTSTDSDGTIALREWDLDGNGSYETTATAPSRSYASAGNVTVGLRVTDDDNATATTTRTVSVQAAPPPPPPTNTPPSPSFTATPSNPQVGQSVSFADTSTDSDGTIALREWDLDGNGSYETTATAPSRSYASAGNVTVGLRVTDDDNATATTTRTVSVQAAPPPPPPTNTPPSPSFTATPSNPQVGQSVSFADTSTDSDGTIALREWDLDGNGSYETTATAPSRSYASAGNVTVGLRVTDDDNATATTTRTVSVQAAPPPPPPAGNLIRNPSFETSAGNWATYQGALTRVQLAGAPDGAWVGRVARSRGTTFTIDDDPESVSSASGAGPYVAEAWVRAATSSSVGKTVRIFLREATPGPSGRYIRTVQGPTVVLSNTFQRITASMTVAAGNELDLYIAQASAASGNAFYVDKVSLTAP